MGSHTTVLVNQRSTEIYHHYFSQALLLPPAW